MNFRPEEQNQADREGSSKPGQGKRRDRAGSAQVLCLAALCAVGSELLAAYGADTGNVPAVLFSLVFFMGLYGAPALLAREVARRAGWGWPSLLLLFLALGIAQACLIDQSLFAEDYKGYEGWAESRRSTFIPALSISAFNAYNFILGHVIYSFGAPVAIAEAWRPQRAAKSWLGPFGLSVATVAYLGTALLIVLDPESRNASAPQLITSIVLVLACIAAAAWAGRRSERRPRAGADSAAPSVGRVFGVTFALVVVGTFAEENWSGFALGIATTALVAAFAWWGAGRPGWGLRHAAAVGVAYLVSRGLFAFTYFPLAGEIEAIPKYAHNVVMLAVVLVAAWLAVRKRS